MSDMIGFVKTAGLKKRYSICILSNNSFDAAWSVLLYGLQMDTCFHILAGRKFITLIIHSARWWCRVKQTWLHAISMAVLLIFRFKKAKATLKRIFRTPYLWEFPVALGLSIYGKVPGKKSVLYLKTLVNKGYQNKNLYSFLTP